MLIRKLLLCLVLGFMFSDTSYVESGCEEPVNVWFKISNDTSNANYGQVIALDMSEGYTYTDGEVIYMILNDAITMEQVILTFPIGHWVVEAKDEIQKEFDSLEEYLRNTEGSLIQKQ